MEWLAQTYTEVMVLSIATRERKPFPIQVYSFFFNVEMPKSR